MPGQKPSLGISRMQALGARKVASLPTLAKFVNKWLATYFNNILSICCKRKSNR